MQNLKILNVQLDIVWENPIANIEKIKELLKNFSQADVIVLPEMWTTGFSMETEKFAEPTMGYALDEMQKIALEKNALVIGSSIIRDGNDYFNRLFAVFPNQSFEFYDKKHLFRMAKEHHHFAAGQEKILIEHKGWKIMPLVCYDLRFPVWSRNELKNLDKGYDLLIYVANWPEKRSHHWKRLLQARAIENQCFIVGCNRVGIDGNGIQYSGDSMIGDFHGDILAENQSQEIVLSAELSKEDLRVYRRAFPAYLDADDFQILQK